MGLIQLLALLSLLLAIGSAAGKVPTWVPVVLLAIVLLIQVWR